MESVDSTQKKKKIGCFTSFIILSIAWFLVMNGWMAYQLVSETYILPDCVIFLFEYFQPENMDYNTMNIQTLFFLRSLNVAGSIILVWLPVFLIQKGMIRIFRKDEKNGIQKKSPGRFASFMIFSIALFLMASCWFAYRHISKTYDLPYNILSLFEYFQPENMDYSTMDTQTLFFLGSLNVAGTIILVLLPVFLLQKGMVKIFWKEKSKEIKEEDHLLPNNGVSEKGKSIQKKMKIALFVLCELAFFFLIALYFFGCHGHADKHDWLESAWLSICLGIFISYMITYISNTIKKGIQFYKGEHPEKALSCFMIALLLVTVWILILNYGMCLFSRGHTFFDLLINDIL